jgi:hypothetical protein
MSEAQAKITEATAIELPKVRTEAEVFDILAEHGIKYVTGQMALDSRCKYAGWLDDGDGVFLWARDERGEQLDNHEIDERCGFREDSDDDLDLDIHMQCKVDAFLPNYYANKRKWEAQGTILYDVEERTITLDFLVRTGKVMRESIEMIWKVDGEELIKKEIRQSRSTKSDLEWEQDHGLWGLWDNPEW